MNTLDSDTQKVLSDGEEVSNLIGSRGWAIIHDKLVARTMDLQNIANLDMSQPDTLNTQIAARILAAQFIKDWLQADVFGFAEQQAANATALIDPITDSFVERG